MKKLFTLEALFISSQFHQGQAPSSALCVHPSRCAPQPWGGTGHRSSSSKALAASDAESHGTNRLREETALGFLLNRWIRFSFITSVLLIHFMWVCICLHLCASHEIGRAAEAGAGWWDGLLFSLSPSFSPHGKHSYRHVVKLLTWREDL